MKENRVFTREDKLIMLTAAMYVGTLANYVQCETCRRWWDTFSPCALCNATTYTTGRV